MKQSLADDEPLVKFALISDLHFGIFSRTKEFAIDGESPRGLTSGEVSLKQGLIDVLNREGIEYILVSGDLTSTGSPHEFMACNKELIDIAKKTSIAIDNVVLSVGNHDVDWKITKMAGELLDKYEEPFPIRETEDQYQFIAANVCLLCMDSLTQYNEKGPAPFSGVVQKKDFVAFVLNSGWCSTHNQDYKHGKLKNVQLNWFEYIAKKYSSDSRWKILLLHHHPFNYPFPVLSPDISTLEEGSELLAIAGKYGIQLICHGHRHHPRAKTVMESGWTKPITFICAGSISVNAEHRHNGEIPNMFHVVELSKEGHTLLLKSYQYSPANGWLPAQRNCPETPIDAQMYLGEVFTGQEIIEALDSLIQNASGDDYLPPWSQLPRPLKSLTLRDLNDKLKTHFSSTHRIVGEYPADVVLLRR